MLFRQHYPDMMRLARLLLHDDAESEDAVGEVFAALLRKDILPTGSSARSFLLTAVRNCCLNVLRNRSIKQRVQGFYYLDSDQVGTADEIEERLALVRRAFDSNLDEISQRVLTQRFVQHFTYAEIAEIEGISETAVYKRIRKALGLLKEKLNNK